MKLEAAYQDPSRDFKKSETFEKWFYSTTFTPTLCDFPWANKGLNPVLRVLVPHSIYYTTLDISKANMCASIFSLSKHYFTPFELSMRKALQDQTKAE